MSAAELSTANPCLIRLFGNPALLASGGVHVLEHRAAALLALVAFEPGISRARAAAMIWPDSPDPRGVLRQQLLRFRRLTDRELISRGESMHLADGVLLEPDGVEAGHVLLEPHSFDDLDDFARWLDRQRRRLVDHEVASARLALTEAEAGPDVQAAVRAARQLVAIDGDNESHHRALMRALYVAADSVGAQAAYRDLVQLLDSRFGAQPSAQTQQLARTLSQTTAEANVRKLFEMPPSLVRPPRRVGREAPWQRMSESWSRRETLFIEANAGLGKSRLLNDFAVSEPAALLVSARPGDEHVPYAVLARLLRGVLERAAAPPSEAVRRELARLLPELQPAVDMSADADSTRLAHAVEAALTAAAGGRLRGVLIDDLQFCDAASAESLLTLSAAPLGLAWIFAARDSGLSAVSRAQIDALYAAHRAGRLQLQPLSVSEIDELLQTLQLADATDFQLAPQWVKRTGGNPLFLLETLKSQWQQEVSGSVSPAVPPTVSAVIGDRLSRLSPQATQLLHCAAIAGQDLSVALAARVLGLRAIDLIGPWAELERAEVLRGNAFTHDLVQTEAQAGIPQAVAGHLHGQVATFLADQCEAHARVAHHWLQSETPQRALTALRAAAVQARIASCTLEAADFLEHAAQLQLQAGDHSGAFDDALAANECLFRSPSQARFEASVAQLLELARSPRQQAHAAFAEAKRLNLRADGQAYRPAIEHAQALALACDEQLVLAQCELALAVDGYRDARLSDALRHAVAAVAMAERGGLTRLTAEALSFKGITLASLGRLEDAETVLTHSVALLEQHATNEVLVQGYGYLAYLALDRGRLCAARAAIDQISHRQIKSAANLLSDAFAAALLGEVLRRESRFAEALAAIDAVAPQGRSNTGVFFLGIERARTWLAIGQTSAARAALASCANGFQPRRRQALLLMLCHGELALIEGRPLPAELQPALLASIEEPLMKADALRLLAPALPARQAHGLISSLSQELQQQGLLSPVPGLLALQARCECDLGEVAAAADTAGRALTLLDHVAPQQPLGSVLIAIADAAAAAGANAMASTARARSLAWFSQTALHGVPEPYRTTFLNGGAAAANPAVRQRP